MLTGPLPGVKCVEKAVNEKQWVLGVKILASF